MRKSHNVEKSDKKPTLITCELSVEQLQASLVDLTLAGAMLDRMVHNNYPLNLTGDSMHNQKKGAKSAPSTPPN